MTEPRAGSTIDCICTVANRQRDPGCSFGLRVFQKPGLVCPAGR